MALCLLVGYTIAAMYVLRQNTVLTVVPIIAAVVYILAALADGLETAENKQAGEAIAEQEFDLEERRAKAEHERRLEAAELRLKHEAKIARIAAKQTAPKSQTVTRQNGRQLPTDWRQLTDSNKRELSGLPPEKIVELTDVSRRTAERWYAKLSENGHKEQVKQ
jgi:hypothetical protein